MLNLHLSRFLSGDPPPRPLQQLNAWAHQEPFDRIIYTLYWFFTLGFFAPIVAMAIPWLFLFETVRQKINKDDAIQPKVEVQGVGRKTQLAVVISGCDSGIGKELAMCLALEGFVVFAGCLKSESFDHFTTLGSSIHPILLDVTNDAQVNSFHATVLKWLSEGTTQQGRQLHALINNAGVGVAGYFDWLVLSDYEYCMNVNYFGIIRMTKAFLPVLKKQSISGGHQYPQIINIISVAGMTSGSGLGASPYEASKHAAEAFTNTLRMELQMFGIRVVALNPGFFDTPLTNNMEQRFQNEVLKRMTPSCKEEYGEEFIEDYVRHTDTILRSGRWNLNVLIDAIVKVVKSKNPPAQLMIGIEKYGHATFNMFPQWVRNALVHLGMPPQTPKILKK